MRKFFATSLVIAMVLLLAACMSSTAIKAIEQSKLAMANSDYTAALNYLRLAEQEGGDTDEVENLISIIDNYIKAKDEYDKMNMDGAAEALKAIPNTYPRYSISKDIEKLKDDVENKRKNIDDIDAQIEGTRKYIADGDYDSASKNITDLYSKDLTEYQKKQVDECKATLDSAKATVPTSSNTNVVATYYVVNCKQSITLRTAPSTSASEIVQIPLGQAVGYIENAGNGFYKINYDGRVGYSLASYLSSSKPSTSTSTSSSCPRTAQVVNCKEWITLRATPSTGGADLAHIPLGAYVTYISEAGNGFYCVEYNGQRGYALQAYLALK